MKKKLLIGLSFLLIVIGLCGGVFIYNSYNTFPKGSYINRIDVSGLSVNDIMDNNTLHIKKKIGLCGEGRSILENEITLVPIVEQEELENLLSNRTFEDVISKKPIIMTYDCNFNENEIYDFVDTWINLPKRETIKSEKPYFELNNNEIVLNSRVDGDELVENASEMFGQVVLYAISQDYTNKTLSFYIGDYDYLFVSYKEEEIKMQETLDKINSFLDKGMIIVDNEEETNLTKEDILSFMIVNKESISYDNEKIKEYVEKNYKNNSLKNNIAFTNIDNQTIYVDCNYILSKVDIETTITNVIEGLENFKETCSTARIVESTLPIENNIFIGDTYVEVSTDKQRLWYFKNGELLLDCPVTTGKKNCETNKGLHMVEYMQRNRTLRGPGYASFVNYWMRFNSDAEGFHDASWRDEFGVSNYLEVGSHGCVNMPKQDAKTLYENIEIGCPVIIY